MKVRQRTTCQTCRRRKISCDGKLPSCSQCHLRNLRCPGYPSNWVFVSHGGGNDHEKTERCTGSQRVSSQINQDARRRSLTRHSEVPIVLRAPEDVPLSKLITTIIRGYVPGPEVAAPERENGSTPRICGAWAEVLPDLTRQGVDKVLISAIRAFAFSILVRHPEENITEAKALEAYSSALLSVHETLDAPQRPSPVELIAAVMCLLFAELILTTTLESWAAHLEGLGKLIQTCEPEYFSSGIPHRLFVGARPALVVLAIQSRKSSFLTLEQWKVVPFREIVPSSMQVLLGEAAMLPSLIERLDKLSGADLEVAKVELRELMASRSRLEAWEIGFLTTREHPRVRYDVPGGYGTLWFDSLTTANGLTHAWSFNVICLANIERIASHFPELSNDIGIARSEISREKKRLSIMICQSMEYLVQDNMKLFGPMSGILPLQTAFEAFRDGGSETMAELRWCEEMLMVYFKTFPFLSLFFHNFWDAKSVSTTTSILKVVQV